MSDEQDIVERLERVAVGGTVNSRRSALLLKAKAEIERLRREVEELKETGVSFIAVHAMRWASDSGFPRDHLHPTHYDILARFGARMDDFVRHEQDAKEARHD